VAAQLAQDRRDREGGEPQAAVGVEAVDGLHQAEVRHLEQVLERLARVPVAARELGGQRHKPLHELLARAAVVEPVQAQKQAALFGRADGVVLGCFYVAGASDVGRWHGRTGTSQGCLPTLYEPEPQEQGLFHGGSHLRPPHGQPQVSGAKPRRARPVPSSRAAIRGFIP
jgi:hypothetical protein